MDDRQKPQPIDHEPLAVCQDEPKLATTSEVVETDAVEDAVIECDTEQDIAERLQAILAAQSVSTTGEFSGKRSVQLNLRAGSVNMELNTNTEEGAEAGELRGQLEFARQMIADLNEKLHANACRIGYLEAQLDLFKSLLEAQGHKVEDITRLIAKDRD